MTDYEQIREILNNVFDTGRWVGGMECWKAQRQLAVSAKLRDLVRLLQIEFEAGEIASVCGEPYPF